VTDLKVSRIFYETWHIIIVERTVLVEALTEEDNFRAVFEDLAVSRIDDVIKLHRYLAFTADDETDRERFSVASLTIRLQRNKQNSRKQGGHTGQFWRQYYLRMRTIHSLHAVSC